MRSQKNTKTSPAQTLPKGILAAPTTERDKQTKHNKNKQTHFENIKQTKKPLRPKHFEKESWRHRPQKDTNQKTYQNQQKRQTTTSTFKINKNK